MNPESCCGSNSASSHSRASHRWKVERAWADRLCSSCARVCLPTPGSPSMAAMRRCGATISTWWTSLREAVLTPMNGWPGRGWRGRRRAAEDAATAGGFVLTCPRPASAAAMPASRSESIGGDEGSVRGRKAGNKGGARERGTGMTKGRLFARSPRTIDCWEQSPRST